MTYVRTRLPLVAMTALLAALCLAACGSSSGSGASSSSTAAAASGGSSGGSGSAGGPAGSSAARSKLAACLKAHGVTLPARPAGAQRRRPPNGGEGGGGFFFGGGGGGGGEGGGGGQFANKPKLRAAFQACASQSGFRPGTARRFSFSHTAVNKFVACVKQHGYNLPPPNFTGKGPIFPANIQSNKRFQAAAKPCAADLRPAGAPGGAPGGGPGGGGPGAPGSASSSGISTA